MQRKTKYRNTSHKNLIVYNKAKALTIDTIKFFSKNKLPYQQKFIVDQLLRSVSSIGANIAEGYGRHYTKSFRHFLSISRGSSFEVDYWLEIVLELNPRHKKIIDRFVGKNLELTKMLTVLMKSMEVDKQK